MANLITVNIELDDEWVELITKARTLGITLEEIRHFLKQMKEDSMFFAQDHRT